MKWKIEGNERGRTPTTGASLVGFGMVDKAMDEVSGPIECNIGNLEVDDLVVAKPNSKGECKGQGIPRCEESVDDSVGLTSCVEELVN